MAKLEIGTCRNGNYMVSVRVTLTNGMQSPLFEMKSKKPRKIEHYSLHFAPTTPITRIGIKCEYFTSGIKIYSTNNLDDKPICEWEQPWGSWKEQTVPNGESIVGVYGRVDRVGILHFGF